MFFSGVVKKSEKQYFEVDKDIEELMAKVIDKYNDSFSNFRFQNGLNEVWSLIGRTNKYIDDTMPWALAKEEDKQERLETVLYNLIEAIRFAAIALEPFMPETSVKILDMINTDQRTMKDLTTFGLYASGTKVTDKPVPLFARLDPKEVEADLFAAKQVGKETAIKALTYIKERMPITSALEINRRIRAIEATIL